jgi:glycosyltransferase involved in cell wall biosynthesis
MKIAIAAPCPQPFVIGGAERLWWGLARYINDATSHQADIIKVPVTETDFWSLLDGYRRFARLDLSGFDVVISGKYPAWMVAHPHHVVYMLHPARGLYEGYRGPSLAEAWPRLDREVRSFVDYLQSRAARREHIDAVFERLAALQKLDLDRGGGLVAWPGPVARETIRWFDAVAMAPEAVTRYAAIAQGLTQRADYFPPSAQVVVAHPPADLDTRPGPDFRYFLSVSRLETYKRVALVVEAMRRVDGNVELWIAGTGPEDMQLQWLAAGDARIRFLGYVSDAELEELYRNALAVPFVPYQEDYGLITVEAMRAGKAVITSVDAGGPTELVRDGVNGYLVLPTADAIAAAMQRLANDVELARRLGAAGRQRVESITWSAVLSALLLSSPDGSSLGLAGAERGTANESSLARMVDLAAPMTDPAQRTQKKKALGIARPLVLVLGGSGTRAGALLQEVCFIARALPEIGFVLPDIEGDAIGIASLPPNLALLGTPSAVARNVIVEAVDVALCLPDPRSASLRAILQCIADGVPVAAVAEESAWPPGLAAHIRVVDELEALPAAVTAILQDAVATQRATRSARAFLEHLTGETSVTTAGVRTPTHVAAPPGMS